MKLYIEKAAFVLMAGAVFLYLIFKAITMPFVLDEGISYLSFIQHGKVLPWMGSASANNHFLNSVLTYLSTQIFGLSALSIRLPNLLAFMVFAFFSFKIGQLLPSRFLKWGFWISLFSAHFLIEFFALSRGYGLSFALLLGFVFYTLRWFESHEKRTVLFAISFIILGVFANLNLFYLLAVFASILVYYFITKKEKQLAIPILISAIFISFFAAILFNLKFSEQLFVGEKLTAWLSIQQLAVEFFPFSHRVSGGLLLSLLFILIGGIFVKKSSKGKLLLLFLVSNLIFIILAHFAMGVNWPINRTAGHLFLLFLLAAFFVLNELQNRIVQAIFILPFLSMIVLFFQVADIKSISNAEWSAQQVPDAFLAEIEKSWPVGAHVSGPAWTKQSFVLQSLVRNRAQNTMQVFPISKSLAPFILVYEDEIESLQPLSKVVGINASKNLFLVETKFQPGECIYQWQSETEVSTCDSFISLINVPFFAKEGVFRAKVTINFESEFAVDEAALVILPHDSTGELLSWQPVFLDDLKRYKTNKKSFDFTVAIHPLPHDVAELRFLIHNVNAHQLQHIRASIALYYQPSSTQY